MRTESARIAKIGSKQGAVSPKNVRLIWAAFAIVGLAFAMPTAWGQQLEPVKGPLALQAPGPFYEATMSGPVYSIHSDFGRVRSFTYAGGETLKGKCETVTAPSANVQTSEAPDNNSQQANLIAAWELVNGEGYYASHVAGNKIRHGTFTGDKGTVLQVESLDNYFAVGVDNRGNLYRIVW